MTLKNTQVSVPVDVHDSAVRAAQKEKIDLHVVPVSAVRWLCRACTTTEQVMHLNVAVLP